MENSHYKQILSHMPVESVYPLYQPHLAVVKVPGSADDNAHYHIDGFNNLTGEIATNLNHQRIALDIFFQKGDPGAVGTNGITIEALLAVAMDHLENHQKGPYPHAKNEEAIKHINAAIQALHDRLSITAKETVKEMADWPNSLK